MVLSQDFTATDYTLGSGRADLGTGVKFPVLGTNGEDNNGSGLKFRYPLSSPKKNDVPDCPRNQVESIAPKALALVPFAFNISCGQIKEASEDFYTEDNCKLLDICGQEKLNRDESTFSNFMLVERMAAEDYAGLMIEDELPAMERLEALRKFADKKFGKDFASACSPRFDYKKAKDLGHSCNKDIVENGFLNANANCDKARGACLILGDDFGKNVSENESAIQSFMNQRTDAFVTNSLEFDNDLLDNLAQMLTSKEKDDEKLKAIFTKLKEWSDDKKIDPVFSFDQESMNPENMKKSAHYGLFKKLLAKNLTQAAAKAEIEKYRRDYTKSVFAKNCKSTASYAEICAKTTLMAKGNSGLYINRRKVARRFNKVDEKRMSLLKTQYPNGIRTEKDALIVLGAQRCKAMGIIKPNGIDYSFPAISGMGEPSLGQGLGNLGSGTALVPPSSNFWFTSFGGSYANTPDGRNVRAASSDIQIDLANKTKLAGQGTADLPKSGSMDSTRTPEEKALADSLSENLKSVSSATGTSLATNNSSLHAPSYNSSTNNSVMPDVPLVDQQQIDTKKVGDSRSTSNELNEKIANLSKKLSATEENLARLKEERQEAEAQNEVQKKRAEDLQTIGDLRKQISDLKTQATKTVEAANSQAAESIETQAPTRSIASSRAPAIVKNGEDDDSSAGRAAAESTARGPANLNSSASSQDASVIHGSTGGPGVISSGNKSVLTLTKGDGMSAEKISEIISNRIMELGGQSFEIEEDGVRIEVVPEVRDGKILLDDKGKPRFVKKVKNGKEVKASKNRVPASITDKADLLRRDEETLKRERAEYLKLKNITNKAVQKN